jgi:glycine/D-amino acid oxidase-like deaminating enzyme
MNDGPTIQVDFLIIGQGLAGTLLSHFLLFENQRIKVIDIPHPGTTSNIAAGIVNPVTGRRFAKSWRYEALFTFAKQCYLDLEKELGITLWNERNILRALHNTFEENEWMRRSVFPDYAPFFADEPDLTGFENKISEPHAWGELRQCAQVDMPELIHVFREKLRREQLLDEEVFDYQELKLQQEGVKYKKIEAVKVIFCEGARALQNPFFNFLPFSVTKGELLIVRIPDAGFEKMLKHHIFMVPLKKDLYWVGSTSRFEFEHEYPTPERRQWLEDELRKTLTIPFEVIEHFAGLRPTVYDIRPFLGLHPEYPQMAIFNGLGTKGASLGPFFAHHLAAFLMGKTPLDSEVDIRRFSDK